MKRFLPLVLARRELRAGARGFRILIACLALGVGTIASVQSLSRDILGGIEAQGRSLLGGDIAIRTIYHGVNADQLRTLEGYGTVSESVDLRGMARTADGLHSTLVEAKAVDPGYPLVGAVQFMAPAEGMKPAEVLAQKDGLWGAAVEQAALDRLGAHLGDRLQLGALAYEIRAVIAKEPDRIGTGGFNLGPRFLVALDSMPATGLMQPGSLTYYDTRILLKPGVTVEPTEKEIRRLYGDAGWRVSDSRDAAPEIRNFVTRLATFASIRSCRMVSK